MTPYRVRAIVEERVEALVRPGREGETESGRGPQERQRAEHGARDVEHAPRASKGAEVEPSGPGRGRSAGPARCAPSSRAVGSRRAGTRRWPCGSESRTGNPPSSRPSRALAAPASAPAAASGAPGRPPGRRAGPRGGHGHRAIPGEGRSPRTRRRCRRRPRTPSAERPAPVRQAPPGRTSPASRAGLRPPRPGSRPTGAPCRRQRGPRPAPPRHNACPCSPVLGQCRPSWKWETSLARTPHPPALLPDRSRQLAASGRPGSRVPLPVPRSPDLAQRTCLVEGAPDEPERDGVGLRRPAGRAASQRYS